ncbi:DUF3035 domain-containing protein [Flavimaricola marinus]|uniref:Lipoprotein n=1 Tax=Flavimaricola marinus TaxID=1819565 RepID=A0A238LH95_9RHOB|nr:DUF3035 domain-containing protein [Flavimaricola marinus]SMY08998.1 hypothetical protein LOM8899_03158 [Flavimaricola marinus]
MKKAVLSMIAVASLAACGSRADGPQLYEATNEPAEYLVVPANPLVIPSTLTLPPPTPGGTNRADSGLVRTAPAPE